MLRISVIIPSYNRAHTLARAIRSVMEQQPVHEIIVVDDGSSDDTQQLLSQQFPDVTYLYQANQGVSAARNNGIAQATGDWIALLDSDDEWLPHKLARLGAALQQNPGHHIIHSDEIWIRQGRRVNAMHKHRKSGGRLYQQCLPLCVISPSAVMLSRSLLDDVGLFNRALPVCEDYEMWLRICHQYPVLYVDEPLIIKYGGHQDQLSRQLWGMDRFRVQALERCLTTLTLSPEDRAATIVILLKKLDILIKGAAKRGRTGDVALYQQIKNRYSSRHDQSTDCPAM